MSKYQVTISLPCYGRPLRTKRAIDCLLSQDMDGWEAIITGDNCPAFQELIDSGYLSLCAEVAEQRGNKIVYENLKERHGGCGFFLTNKAIQQATGEFFVFFANDDVILPNHLTNYLSSIRNTSLNMVCYPIMIEAGSIGVSNPVLRIGSIGHGNLIVRTNVAKMVPAHDSAYDHDWKFISHIMNKHKMVEVDLSKKPTYIVKSIPTHPEIGID